MVPNKAVIGSIVVVLNGGKVPILLRSLPTTEREPKTEELRCHLLGPVYVHGLMDGEAQSWAEEKKLGIETQEFVLS